MADVLGSDLDASREDKRPTLTSVLINPEELGMFLGLTEEELGDPSASTCLLMVGYEDGESEDLVAVWNPLGRMLVLGLGGPDVMALPVKISTAKSGTNSRTRCAREVAICAVG